MEELFQSVYKQEISQSDFLRLSSVIYKICGIVLPETKKILVEGRIRRRIMETGFQSYEKYIEYLFSEPGMNNEITPLVDIITTNKTDFFRENNHFEYLVANALPRIINNIKEKHTKHSIRFWSAGCSTGEEPYTLAIVLKEFFEKWKEFEFSVYATDISASVLQKARLGVFEYDKIDVIPENLKKKYLLKNKDPEKKCARVVPELRSLVEFSNLNLMDEDYDLPALMDVVFCRNVLIYFDKKTQENVINKFAQNMKTGGYLFLGHSESILGMDVPFERAASTIYIRI